VLGQQACHQQISAGARRCRTSDRGFSLLEVLIATAVFSLGLAGFAALLLTSMTGSAQARREAMAAMAAASLAEQIRLNPLAVDRYLHPPADISKICNGESPCTPAQQADYDFRLWQIELADRIRNARGLVCRDETPQDGVEGNGHCDGAGPPVIKTFSTGQAGENGVAQQHRFVLEAS